MYIICPVGAAHSSYMRSVMLVGGHWSPAKRIYRTLDVSNSTTPSPPTKSFPIKSPRVELSGRLPINLYGHENSHPLELRVCLSQTLRNLNS